MKKFVDRRARLGRAGDHMAPVIYHPEAEFFHFLAHQVERRAGESAPVRPDNQVLKLA